ncbi:hypothetical protein, partial [Kitasatospora sp. NPDC089509]|uniref:hypothetical protein n=1 Tax=Kitasatospora sp. NPDC089509 TaxID=3364079 RepID=UPI003826038C
LAAGPPGASFFRVSSLPDVFRSVFRGFVIQLTGVFCGLTPRPTFQTLADPRSEKRIRLQSDKTHMTNKPQARTRKEREQDPARTEKWCFKGLATPGPSAL